MGETKPERPTDEVAAPTSAGVGGDSRPLRHETGPTRKPYAETTPELWAQPVSSLAQVSPAIAEIDNLITDLRAARDYLQSEGDRIQREVRRYTELGQAASASVKIVMENLSVWRNAGTVPTAALSRNP